jgi:type II secretory ATPase GspE/PulE/Tfp pilus assembly ATPase PilB-like protein
MLQVAGHRLADEFAGLDPADPQYATSVVDRMLAAALAAAASDIHLQPTDDGLQLKFRIDGVLRPAAVFPAKLAANIIARLKVLAQLLTYRTDCPQEGRIRTAGDVEVRVCSFPTLHGERAVVRLFGGLTKYQRLDDLGLPQDVSRPLRHLLGETSGAILVSGPAGSGKTTTVYACLRELAQQTACQRSLVSLEDPIEVAVDGLSQSQVNPAAGLDLATGLRFLLRHDPEVIMVGEIRDRATAEAALQASLTGHLLLSTFHAGSAAETVGRLLDMGIEPYVLRSGLLAILCQRLLRRLCNCAQPSDDPDVRLGLPVGRVMVPRGCPECGGSGYRGRFLLVEMLSPTHTELGRAILSRCDAAQLQRLAVQAGMVTRWQRACRAVDAGLTSPAEVRRVLGFSAPSEGTELGTA